VAQSDSKKELAPEKSGAFFVHDGPYVQNYQWPDQGEPAYPSTRYEGDSSRGPERCPPHTAIFLSIPRCFSDFGHALQRVIDLFAKP
jgi:hypothetical protein